MSKCWNVSVWIRRIKQTSSPHSELQISVVLHVSLLFQQHEHLEANTLTHLLLFVNLLMTAVCLQSCLSVDCGIIFSLCCRNVLIIFTVCLVFIFTVLLLWRLTTGIIKLSSAVAETKVRRFIKAAKRCQIITSVSLRGDSFMRNLFNLIQSLNSI